jgi:hypothetical protein
MTFCRRAALAAVVLCSACSAPEPRPAAPKRSGTQAAAPCRLDGADGSRLALDVPANASNCDLQRFVFNNFLYLAGDDATGHPRFMSYAPWYEAIPQDGSAPVWRDGYKPLSTTALRKTSREGQPGDGYALIDVDRRRVGYDIRVNRTFVDYLVASGTWQEAVLQAASASFAQNPATGGVWLPSGSATSEGAITVKTSWRKFPQGCPAERMHCERDGDGVWRGLVGLHLVQKTPTLGEMTWASFEHVANAPDCAPGGTRPIAAAPADPADPGKTLPGGWSLFDYAAYKRRGGDGERCPVPDGAYQYTVASDGTTIENQTCGAPSQTPLCNTDPRLSTTDNETVEGYHRIDVCRTVAAKPCVGDGGPDDDVACLNADFARRFPKGVASKWRYYFLVGSEYVAGHAPGVGCFRYDDGPTLTTTPPRSRFPSTCQNDASTPQLALAGTLKLANTTMETWMQDGTCMVSTPGSTPLMGRDCMACHTPSTNPPGFPFGMGDMSFLFDRVPTASKSAAAKSAAAKTGGTP